MYLFLSAVTQTLHFYNTVCSSYGNYFVLFQLKFVYSTLSKKLNKVNQFRFWNSQDSHFWELFSLQTLSTVSGDLKWCHRNLKLSFKIFQLKHTQLMVTQFGVFFLCGYCVERTKSDYDEQGVDQTGKIKDHAWFSQDIVFSFFPDLYSLL